MVGTAGWGQVSIEHFFRKELKPELELEYSNCFLACKLCNDARGRKPNEKNGARLLNPSEVAWAQHFQLKDFALVANANDKDAEHTVASYALDDPRKTELRKIRFKVVSSRTKILRELPAMINKLHEKAMKLRADNPARAREIVQEAETLSIVVTTARDDLRRYSSVPADKPDSCRCPI